eukprot:4555772-Pyramimonas_sp.AAC.1
MSGALEDWALGGWPCSSAALFCRVVLPAPGRCQRHGGGGWPARFSAWTSVRMATRTMSIHRISARSSA